MKLRDHELTMIESRLEQCGTPAPEAYPGEKKSAEYGTIMSFLAAGLSPRQL